VTLSMSLVNLSRQLNHKASATVVCKSHCAGELVATFLMCLVSKP